MEEESPNNNIKFNQFPSTPEKINLYDTKKSTEEHFFPLSKLRVAKSLSFKKLLFQFLLILGILIIFILNFLFTYSNSQRLPNTKAIIMRPHYICNESINVYNKCIQTIDLKCNKFELEVENCINLVFYFRDKCYLYLIELSKCTKEQLNIEIDYNTLFNSENKHLRNNISNACKYAYNNVNNCKPSEIFDFSV